MSSQEDPYEAPEAIRFNPTVKVDKASYVWEIERYSSHHAKGEHIKSPIFTSATSNQFKWYLKLYPNNTSVVVDPSISIFLYLDSSSHHKLAFARPKLSIIDNQLNKSYVKLGQVHEYTVSPVHGYQHPRGWTEFIKIDQLFGSKYLSKDKLTLCCEVTFFRIEENLMDNMCEQYDSFFLQPNVPKYDLSEDLRSLLKNQEFADVIISINHKEYPVHKAILAARSPVFAAMFQHNMQESETNRIDITDVEERVVGEMLRYMYTGTCECLKELADGLILVADKYDLQGLKVMCEESLIENLSVENATHMLVLADLHRADKLKSKTLNYIVSKSTKVMKTTGWKCIAPVNPHLIMEVSEGLSKAYHREKKHHSCKRIKLSTAHSSKDAPNPASFLRLLNRPSTGLHSRSNAHTEFQ